MKPLFKPVMALALLSSAGSCALLPNSEPVAWRVAGALPPSPGSAGALGVAGPLTGRLGDLLLVGGGANFPDSMPWLGGKKKYYDEIYAFRKERDGTFQVYKKGKLPFPLAYGTSVATPMGVVSAGGENDRGLTRKVLLLQWDTATDSLAVRYLPDLPLPLTNAAGAAIGSVVYLAGGETPEGGVSQGFYRLDLADTASGWVPLPALPHPVSHAVLLATGGGANPSIYLIGGRKKNPGATSDLYASVFAFAPGERRWQAKRPLPYALSAGTGLSVGAGDILLFGGDRGETFHKTESLIAAIAGETDEQQKKVLTDQKTALQSAHPGFSQEVLRYHSKEDAWTVEGSLPFETPVTTTALKWGREVILPSGEIRAGVRTPRIWMGKLND